MTDQPDSRDAARATMLAEVAAEDERAGAGNPYGGVGLYAREAAAWGWDAAIEHVDAELVAARADADRLAAALRNALGCQQCAATSAGCGYWRDAEAALARHEEPRPQDHA